jgi:hypothetical protein
MSHRQPPPQLGQGHDGEGRNRSKTLDRWPDQLLPTIINCFASFPHSLPSASPNFRHSHSIPHPSLFLLGQFLRCHCNGNFLDIIVIFNNLVYIIDISITFRIHLCHGMFGITIFQHLRNYPSLFPSSTCTANLEKKITV